jgi:hypothetical protein
VQSGANVKKQLTSKPPQNALSLTNILSSLLDWIAVALALSDKQRILLV